jgi:hypothetical protein
MDLSIELPEWAQNLQKDVVEALKAQDTWQEALRPEVERYIKYLVVAQRYNKGIL